MLKQVLISESVGKTIEDVRFYDRGLITKYTDNTFSFRDRIAECDEDEKGSFLTYEILRYDINPSHKNIGGFSKILIDMGIIDETLLRQEYETKQKDLEEFRKQKDFKEYQRLKKIFENEHTDQSSN